MLINTWRSRHRRHSLKRLGEQLQTMLPAVASGRCLHRHHVVCLALLLLVAGPTAVRGAHDDRLVVAVITPLVANLPVGQRHLASVKAGFDELNSEIVVDGRTYRLEIDEMNSRGNEAGCSEVAERLGKSDAVVALGPVTSGCAEVILDRVPNLPLVTPLATATELARPGGRFFRTTANDRERLRQLLERFEEPRVPDKIVALVEVGNTFAEGLARDLGTFVSSPDDLVTITWKHEGAEGVDWALGEDPVVLPSKVLGDVLSSANGKNAVNLRVLVFGHGQDAVRIVAALGKALREGNYPKVKAQFGLLGPKGDDISGLPAGTLSIGEDPFVSDDKARRIADSGLVLGSYEAARFIVPTALRVALSARTERNAWGVAHAEDEGRGESLAERRDAVAEALRWGRFDTSTPGRLIRFEQDGELSEPPELVVYRAAQSGLLVNHPPTRSWVDVHIPQRVDFPFEPVAVNIERHGTVPSPIEIDVFRDGSAVPVTTLIFGDENRRVFHPFRPGSYSFRVRSVPSTPAIPTADVTLGSALGIAAFMAAISALLLIIARWQWSTATLLGSTVAGIALAWAVEYLRQAQGPDSPFPIPSFAPDRDINIIVAAFIGAVLGAQGLINRVRRLLHDSHSEGDARESEKATPQVDATG